MTGAVVMRVVRPQAPAGEVVSHVFGPGRVVEEQATRLARLVEPGFVAECGWDVAGQVLAPPADHPRLGWQEPEGQTSGAVACAVPGCQRSPGSHGLCRAHRTGQLQRGMSVEEYAAAPARRALIPFGVCQVVACPRERSGGRVAYCEPHQTRWLREYHADPGLDEARWRLTTSPLVVTGQVSLAGMPPLITAQVLYGLQQRTRTGAHTRIQMLRAVVEDLRRSQAATVELPAEAAPGTVGREKRTVLNALARHARLALTDPESERVKDAWELAVFGLGGRLSFTAVSQPWLREATKRWAADELPRRRGNGSGRVMRGLVGSMARLSRSLRVNRADHGDHPAALDRTDLESFLHRLAYLVSAGECSLESRARICRDVKRILGRIRALGLTRPDGPAVGLGEDFILASGDIPAEPERGEPAGTCPRPSCGSCVRSYRCSTAARPARKSGSLSSCSWTPAGGRRRSCVCAGTCRSRDPDGAAVLVYDNHKRYRRDRRLPISQATADLITAQQARVRDRFPDTPLAELVLLPTPHANPAGRRAISGGLLDMRHRTWVDQLPAMRRDDGTEFDRSKIVPYAYRHTYAQRHADAGVAIDVLSALLDHRTLDVTRRYYRVGEDRRRAAVDTVTALSFDRHGTRIWRDTQALLDSEHARYAVGEVAVPYGKCAEPSNVQAGGGACPVRYRCAGCDHFRTDVSYLPDLTAYLDDLLRTRERLAAAVPGLDEWARADATPTEEEITRIRRLINRIKGDLAGLDDAERAQIDHAVTAVRRRRAAHTITLGMPTIRPTTPASLTSTNSEATA